MTFIPYPHQRQVADLLLAGKNVILQAPTGSGKTRAALLPFLESLHPESGARGHLPPKCIYAVPMRILAKQFHVEFRKTLHDYGLKIARPLHITIQTGDQQEDRELTGDLIFATIDQLLSSFLIAPYSLSRRKANLNAGAVLSSYLVFDEFHLFDPDSTLPTTLHMLKMLKGITPFVLMTATFSTEMLVGLAEQLDAEVVGSSDEERAAFSALPSQQKERFYHIRDEAMNAEFIIRRHTGRSLVICNTVARARHVYKALKAQADARTEVRLLHSRFLPQDRQELEDHIRTIFGKDAQGTDAIIVSTQAIEVGVDMSSTVLHTELAPANAIIQRAGRCARYEGETGHVYIYNKALDEKDGEFEIIDLCERVLPYGESGQKTVIKQTWKAFEKYSGKALSYDDEQAVLSEAHKVQDEQIIQNLREQDRTHRQSMYAVMRGDPGEDARNLIRQVIAQPVVIHADPAEVARNPFAYPSFSLHPGTVQKHVQDWLERRKSARDISIIRENPDEEAAQSNQERYQPQNVDNSDQVWLAKLLVIHPRLATYNDKIGFIAEHGGDWQASLSEKKSSGESGGRAYRLETYAEHIRLVHQAFTEFWSEMSWAAAAIERRAGWQPGSLHQAAELAVLLHDVGKLSKGWQDWVRKYQQTLVDAGVLGEDHLAQPGQAYAHTDFDSHDERYREIQQAAGPRPWHAVEGALAVIPILKTNLYNPALFKIVYSAIARHHAPFSYQNEEFILIEEPIAKIDQKPKGVTVDYKFKKLNNSAVKNRDLRGTNVLMLMDNAPAKEVTTFLAYLLLVRALRRADAEGTARGARREKA